MWLSPGQTKQVAVDIVIPAGTGQNTVNTITLSVVGTQISEKTVYVYVQDAFSKVNTNRDVALYTRRFPRIHFSITRIIKKII